MNQQCFFYLCKSCKFKVLLIYNRMVTLRIKEILKEKSMKANDLASSLEISTVALSNIVTGKSFPSGERIEAIAKFLDVPVWQLFTSPRDVTGGATAVCPHCGKPITVKLEV